jgi:hypothetical protein
MGGGTFPALTNRSRPPWLHVQSFPASKRPKFTTNALYRQFETYIPRKETVQPCSQFLQHVAESDLYIPTISLIWNLYFPALLDRTLCSTAGAERRAGNCRQAVDGSSSLPSPSLLLLSREFTNFLFGLRVTESPNMTLALDSHQLFICSATKFRQA